MKTIRDPLGFVYVGRNDYARDYIRPKIGQTKQELNARESAIRSHDKNDRHFKMLGCLELKNTTKAEREHIESEVRYHMEKFGRNIKNDHFLIRAKAKKYQDVQYYAFALVALCYAMDCCEREGFKYKLKIF